MKKIHFKKLWNAGHFSLGIRGLSEDNDNFGNVATKIDQRCLLSHY